MPTVESNLRVDISGGTLDLWPLFNFVGGAKTINAAVSLKATSSFDLLDDNRIEVSITNLDFKKTYKNIKNLLDSTDYQLDILKPVLRNYQFAGGFRIETKSESPVGGGLGGSSTLLVSVIKSIDKSLKITRSEADTVDFACNLESEILNTPAGTQDYFQAVKPGLSMIQFGAEGRKREFFSSPWLNNFKSQFRLIYSGHPHHSGLNNWMIFQKCVQKDKETLSILKSLKEVSEMVYFDLHTPTGSNMSELLNEELVLRRRLATGFVNPPLEKIISFLQSIDINHFKICGAGGGGCLWALVPNHLESELVKIKSLHSEIRLIDCELML